MKFEVHLKFVFLSQAFHKDFTNAESSELGSVSQMSIRSLSRFDDIDTEMGSCWPT